MLNFNMALSEEEMLALIEVINRAYEIDYPQLMYYNVLLKLEERLLEEIKIANVDFNKLNN